MADYSKLYTMMFNAATDALKALDQLDIGTAREILRNAQCQAEEAYIRDKELVLRVTGLEGCRKKPGGK